MIDDIDINYPRYIDVSFPLYSWLDATNIYIIPDTEPPFDIRMNSRIKFLFFSFIDVPNSIKTIVPIKDILKNLKRERFRPIYQKTTIPKIIAVISDIVEYKKF